MFCSHTLNNLLNQVHERAFRLTYNNHVSSFEDIIEVSNEKIINQHNLVCLAKEVYTLLMVYHYL